MGNYISLFKDCIKNSDIRKSKDLLLDLHLNSDQNKIAILDELSMVSDEVAYTLLDFIIRLESKYYKSFQFHAYDRLIQLITDRAHLNFDFALILYKSKDREKILKATSLLKYILTNCTDREILFETINAIGNEKIESLVPAIGEFLYYDDATLKDQAIKNLVTISSPEAYKILFNISKTVKNDRNIIAALDSFKPQKSTSPEKSLDIEEFESDKKPIEIESSEKAAEQQTEDQTKEQQISISSINQERADGELSYINMLGSQSIEDRFKAFNYFLNSDSKNLKPDSQYIKSLIENLKSNNHDLVINTLKIISHTPFDEILPDIYSFLNRKNSDPSLEYAAFEALCSFENFSFTELMMSAIEKKAIHVRISAIKALDKNYNDPVYAKVKNRVETGREYGESLVNTIIDAQANNLINYLLVSDAFADMASTYLIKNAAPSALNNYLNILINRGLKSTAKKIEFKADMEHKLQNMLKVMVISTSDTVHKIYEKLLFNNGYIAIGFKTPEEAFELISTDKPDLIVSDLFSKDMTALDFSKEIREFYSKNDLPFLISTHQNDFLNIDLVKNYPDCGINGIFKFPEIIKGINELII
ncbi:MAG: response regulator [Desulfamplus sp.]|nr:response regulator [Desulfamplus sp.]MBF0411883.1 response regulator [Desulfamplus sp.]